MKKKRGGQNKHWAEEARVLTWYFEIRKNCNWSDYRLDFEFAWTEEGEKHRSTADRPRTFEWIRKSARKPAGRDKRWRDMDNLVAVVDQHPLFHGTQAIYMSPFWDLLQEQNPSARAIQRRIDQLLGVSGLIRVNPMLDANLTLLIEKYRLESVFDRCLMLSLRTMDKLSGITLTWSLYQQTEPAHNWKIREVLEKIVDKQLDDFFEHYFSFTQDLDYYSNAIGVLLHSKIDTTERDPDGYGQLEIVGTWPIIPRTLLGKISEGHLFYHFE